MKTIEKKEDCLDCSEFEREQKRRADHLKTIKPKFDKIRKKDYTASLIFWEKNLDVFCRAYYLSSESNSIGTYLMQGDYLLTEEDLNNPDLLTNSPATKEERKILNKWYLFHYSEKFSNFNKTVAEFNQHIQTSRYPVEYIKSEIEKLEKPPQRKTFNQDHLNKIFLDYKLRNQEPNWEEAPAEVVHDFAKIKLKVDSLFFLEEQLKKYNSETDTSKIRPHKLKTLKKLIWIGTQKELGELFIELMNKGFVKEIDMGAYELNQIAENICNLFDLTSSKKSKNSDELKSFYQILKGEPDPKNSVKRVYPQIYTARYQRKFERIKNKKG